MSIKETIRAEIERRLSLIYPLKGDFTDGSRDAYEGLLSWLDTLPEQPASKEFENFNAAFDKYMKEHWTHGTQIKEVARHFAMWGIHTAETCKVEEFKPEQPVEGLEEEIEKRYEQAKWGYVDGFGATVMDKGQFIRIARHFAEWGAEHLKQ